MSENAKAEAAVNDMLAKVWLDGGDAAAKVFLIQQIEMVLNKVLEVPARLKVENVQVVDDF